MSDDQYRRIAHSETQRYADQRRAAIAAAQRAGHTVAASPAATVIAAVDDMWAQLRTEHPGLPPVSVSIGTRRGTQCGYARAYAGTSALRIDPAVLADGAEAAFAYVLHAAAHALAAARGITDTRTRGRYHTREFAALAEQVGMDVPEAHTPGVGFADAVPSAAAKAAHAEALAALRKYVPEVAEADHARPSPKRTGERARAICGCPDARPVWMSRALLSTRTVGCFSCGQPYTESDGTARDQG
ncbi:hypothetical protein ACIQFP_10510 [Nocardiopsis alba]|uniref:hypothetical protein n=1 Tax=Nocardiopsis alba TaxID=53437 RepID=UPI00382674C7